MESASNSGYKLGASLTQYHMWHPHFSKLCFKSVMFKLSPRFIEYLLQDGVFMPEQDPKYDDQSDSSSNQSEEGEKTEQDKTIIDPVLIEEASELRKHITQFIKEDTSSGVFVKLNWSAPRDASWINPMLQCVTADEIFTLLKSSTFVTHDI